MSTDDLSAPGNSVLAMRDGEILADPSHSRDSLGMNGAIPRVRLGVTRHNHGVSPTQNRLPPNDGSLIAVIGGTGFYSLFDDPLSDYAAEQLTVDTPFGAPSAPISVGVVSGKQVAFLPRHGLGHEYPPHKVNYRANLWALRTLGARRVFAPCAVGSLRPELGPGTVVIPDQLVDRTTGRAQTYFDDGAVHVQFADPYCEELRRTALQPGTVDGAVMVVVEGPRFSTRAESRWFAAQGWSLVNMTGHPEALLARELEMCYATIALITDHDAGVDIGAGVSAVDVYAEFERNIGPFKQLVRQCITDSPPERECTACLVHDGVQLPFSLP